MALLVVAVLGLGTVWTRQQDAARRSAEARAEAAEVALAGVRATLTAVVHQMASASETAVVQGDDPRVAVQRALRLVFASYQEPNEQRLRALADAFTPAALAVVRPEAEHLLSAGLHLAGESTYDVEVLGTTQRGPDQVEVRTRERWVYDERSAAGQRERCVREEGGSTYTLRRRGLGWIVEEIQLGSTRRSEC